MHRRRPILLRALLLTSLALAPLCASAPSVAAAQPAAAPQKRDEAVSRYQKGVEFFQEGDFQASLIEEAERLVDERLAREVRAIDGAREAVMWVRGKRCICSNSGTARLESTLRRTGLLPFFHGAVFSAADMPSGRPKPAPDVFLHAAQTMGADPRETFVIEDSVHGVTGARAAGMRVIGFTGASHTHPGHADLLTEAGAETVIRRWKDFPAVVGALSEWSDGA